MNWFYEGNGKQCGPVREAQLLDGRITAETLVGQAGQTGWLPQGSLWPHLSVPGGPRSSSRRAEWVLLFI